MPSIYDRFTLSEAQRKWLREQRDARRARMVEEAKASPDDLTQAKKELGLDEKPKEDPRDFILTQEAVDKVRARVQYTRAFEAIKRERDLDKMPVAHVWFPENDVRKYTLRDGNPPAEVDRPKHMRGLKLAIDVASIPEILRLKIEFVVKEKNKKRHRHKSPSNILMGNRALMNELARRAGLVRG